MTFEEFWHETFEDRDMGSGVCDMYRAFWDVAQSAEREACAKVAEALACDIDAVYGDPDSIAETIRAMGSK